MSSYYKRRWDELREDGHADWGLSWWLFEVDSEGYPTRQIEIYDNGSTKRYGPEVPDDVDGGLGSARLDEVENWSQWQIDADEFNRAWAAD